MSEVDLDKRGGQEMAGKERQKKIGGNQKCTSKRITRKIRWESKGMRK